MISRVVLGGIEGWMSFGEGRISLRWCFKEDVLVKPILVSWRASATHSSPFSFGLNQYTRFLKHFRLA